MMRRLLVTVMAVGLFGVGTPGSAVAETGWELSALKASAAHEVSTGKGVTVAVLDTGIRTKHPALKGRATEGPDFLRENDQDESWYGLHGTSMASSVLDVAPGARVLGLRVIRDREDPDYESWEESLRRQAEEGPAVPSESDQLEATAQTKAIRHAVDSGAKVISMSLGSESPFAPYVPEEAKVIQEAIAQGVVIVAAVGNDGDEGNEVAYPAAYPGVITVAAVKPDGSHAKFSSVHSYVDVAAPGVAINGADAQTGGRTPVNGTSSATALTSGVVALLLERYPDLAPRQIKDILQRTASTFDEGHNPLTGYGVINAEAALRAAADVAERPAALPVGTAGAGKHFGPGDDGTPRQTEVGLDPEYTTIGTLLGGSGLVLVVGGSLLYVSGRRRAQRSDGPSAAP